MQGKFSHNKDCVTLASHYTDTCHLYRSVNEHEPERDDTSSVHILMYSHLLRFNFDQKYHEQFQMHCQLYNFI